MSDLSIKQVWEDVSDALGGVIHHRIKFYPKCSPFRHRDGGGYCCKMEYQDTGELTTWLEALPNLEARGYEIDRWSMGEKVPPKFPVEGDDWFDNARYWELKREFELWFHPKSSD
jgi:hypothetical protein